MVVLYLIKYLTTKDKITTTNIVVGGTRKGEVCNFNPLYPPENQYENCPYEPYAVNGTDRYSRYCRPNVLCNFDRMGKERPITQEHG